MDAAEWIGDDDLNDRADREDKRLLVLAEDVFLESWLVKMLRGAGASVVEPLEEVMETKEGWIADNSRVECAASASDSESVSRSVSDRLILRPSTAWPGTFLKLSTETLELNNVDVSASMETVVIAVMREGFCLAV